MPRDCRSTARWLATKPLPFSGRGFASFCVGLAAFTWAGCESEPIDSSETAGTVAVGGAANTAGSGGGTTHGSGGSDAGGGGSSATAGAGDSEDATPAPELEGLVVAGVEIGLKPTFDPETTRYSVLASDPEGDLTVVALAGTDLEIEVQKQAAVSGVPVALPDVKPGSGFEVEVMNADGDSRKYRILYLPADFPNFHVAERSDSASEDPLYLSARSPGSYYVVKLNNAGVPLFYRETAQPSFDFKKHPTGQISYAEFRDGTTLAEQIVLDETYTEVDRVTTVGLVDTDEHEFLIQPNGNYIVLAYEPVVRDLTEFGRGSAETILDGIWQELSPDREVLFQWNAWDHMVFGETVYEAKDPRDYSHMNSVFVDDDGNWIVSSRGMAQVLKIDRSSGEVIWKLGGAQNDFTFVNDPFLGFCGQHTASILDNGHLLVFDNGQYCYEEIPERGELTRITEYAIDEDAMTAELVWSYSREGAYCRSQGSAQRLANGNTLIGWGLGTELIATEVTPDHRIVFELQAEAASGDTHSYRARRFAE